VTLLTKIAHASKRHWGYPERFIEAWRPSLTITPEMIRTQIINAARSNGDTAGFYVLIPFGNRVELEAFWVEPGYIGSGVGRAMFQHAVETAHGMGASYMDITSDPNAEGFYERMGTVRIGQVPAPVDGKPRSLPRLVFRIPRVPR
jgi:GNAT superfamily N-acetyltransferase